MPLTETRLSDFSRRGFLTALGGLAAVPAFSRSPLAESLLERGAGSDARLFASAYKQADGSFGIGLLDDYGQVLARITLPGRGHGVAVSPDRRRLVAFARRPGTFALLIGPFDDADPLVFSAEPDRHFCGHGCFSADGRLLYAVENDFVSVRGVLGVYDLSGKRPRRIGELETWGIGPHESVLSADGRTLIVANGGIETHPDRGREKLNLETMQPSVAYLDAATGDLLARHRLDASLHQLSLRHMAVDARERASGSEASMKARHRMRRPLLPSFRRITRPAPSRCQRHIPANSRTISARLRAARGEMSSPRRRHVAGRPFSGVRKRATF